MYIVHVYLILLLLDSMYHILHEAHLKKDLEIFFLKIPLFLAWCMQNVFTLYNFSRFNRNVITLLLSHRQQDSNYSNPLSPCNRNVITLWKFLLQQDVTTLFYFTYNRNVIIQLLFPLQQECHYSILRNVFIQFLFPLQQECHYSFLRHVFNQFIFPLQQECYYSILRNVIIQFLFPLQQECNNSITFPIATELSLLYSISHTAEMSLFNFFSHCNRNVTTLSLFLSF
jgi:hypothetical protein